MLTRCPDCHTVYRVTEEQLQAASGRVRCGRCGEVFDARAETIAAAVPPAPRPAAEADAAESAANPPAVESPPAAAQTTGAAPGARPPSDDIPAALRDDLEPPPRPVRHTGWWVAAALLLTVTLLGQYAYYMRESLAAEYPQLRPYLVRMCAYLRPLVPCTVPLPKDVRALRMLASDVSEHPQVGDALLVQATFVNTAPHPQRYPLLEVRLANLRGETVAQRRFRPEEYLDDGIDAAAGLPPETPVTVTLEVVKPQTDVTNFMLDFL